MSDLHLRELERKWRETGSPADEAAYLRERVRAGQLPAQKLAFAAYCGHYPAQLATAHASQLPHDHAQWLEGLESFGRQLAAEATLALASRLVNNLRPELTQRGCWLMIERSISAVRGYLETAGSDECAKLTPLLAEFEALHAEAALHWGGAEAEWAVLAVLQLIQACTSADPVVFFSLTVESSLNATWSDEGDGDGVAERKFLAAWALGADPLPGLCSQ